MTNYQELEQDVGLDLNKMAEMPASFSQQSFLFIVAGLIILLDQVSKQFIESWLAPYEAWAPFPEFSQYFQILHVFNTGAAFGLFANGGILFAIVAFFVSLVIIYYNYNLPAGMMLLRTALGLQLGGAFGNLIDRFRLGHVTDFLDFGPWPIFNLADTSIVAGVVILAVIMWREQKEENLNVE